MANRFRKEEWGKLFKAESNEQLATVCALVDYMTSREKWDMIATEPYQETLIRVYQESPFPLAQVGAAVEVVECFGKLIQAWSHDFDFTNSGQLKLLVGAATRTTRADEKVLNALFYPLYKGLTSARKKFVDAPLGCHVPLEWIIPSSGKSMRPVEGEEIDPEIAADLDVSFREIPDANKVVRPYVEAVVKNAQILKRETGSLLSYDTFMDLAGQHAVRNPALSITDYEGALFAFSDKIGEKLVDLNARKRDTWEPVRMAHHFACDPAYNGAGRDRER